MPIFKVKVQVGEIFEGMIEGDTVEDIRHFIESPRNDRGEDWVHREYMAQWGHGGKDKLIEIQEFQLVPPTE